MSLAQRIRDAIRGKSLTKAQIELEIGEPLKYAVSQLLKRGEYTVTIDEGMQHYSLATGKEDLPVRRKKKATKRPKRLEGFKARKRKLREIAHKLRTPAPDVKAIALDNLIAQADALGEVVRAQVDDIDDCPPLKIAIANLDRAKALYQAAA